MIRYLEGSIVDIDQKSCTVISGGVGYEVFLPLPSLVTQKIGDSAVFFIYSHIREDQFSLFGFLLKEERMLFEKLISVSGVGPKSALVMLSVHSAASLARAIESGDAAALSHAPGIGKKTAERMIIELKGKCSFLIEGKESDSLFEVRLALEALGYTPKEIHSTLSMIKDTNKETNVLIREALSLLR